MKSIADLQTATYKNSTCLGLSVASSLVSLVKDSQVLPSNYSDTVNKLATSFVRSYHISRSLLDAANYDAVVLFNGRFASVKGAWFAAKQGNLPIFFHERGSDKSSFSLRSCQPHDRVKIQEEMLHHWEKNKVDSAKKIGANFFLSKRNGLDKAWVSFKKNPNKLNYIYVLTPKGITEKTKLTLNFMKRKMAEYDELKAELKKNKNVDDNKI